MNIYDTAVASPPHSSDHPDAVRGPWVPVLTDQYGEPCEPDEFEEGDSGTPEIAVVRGSAAPSTRGARRPASYRPDDVLYEINIFDSTKDLANRWAQARMVAALLNANQDKLDALAEAKETRGE